MYPSAYDFWLDLLLCYGKTEAVRIANSYLDLPTDGVSQEEMEFRQELYHLTMC